MMSNHFDVENDVEIQNRDRILPILDLSVRRIGEVSNESEETQKPPSQRTDVQFPIDSAPLFRDRHTQSTA